MDKNNLWFKQKIYGWGWVPCNWKGWAVTAFYIIMALVLYPLMTDYGFIEYEKTMLGFWVFTFIWVTSFLLILFKKGEKPKWRWGNK